MKNLFIHDYYYSSGKITKVITKVTTDLFDLKEKILKYQWLYLKNFIWLKFFKYSHWFYKKNFLPLTFLYSLLDSKAEFIFADYTPKSPPDNILYTKPDVGLSFYFILDLLPPWNILF